MDRLEEVARIKDGALVGCDMHYCRWKDNGEVFTVKDFGHTDRKRLVADGYGSKANYGNGAIYVKSTDLIPIDTPIPEPQPDQSRLLSDEDWEKINSDTGDDVVGMVIGYKLGNITSGELMDKIALRCDVTAKAQLAKCDAECQARVDEVKELLGKLMDA